MLQIPEPNFIPFPVIQTTRLTLRQLTVSDATALLELRTNPEAAKHIDKTLSVALEDVTDLIKKWAYDARKGNRIVWGITLNNQRDIIGTIGFHMIHKEHFRAEVGYMLSPQNWNHGFMFEALTAIIHFGFQSMGLHSIEARVNPSNSGSTHLLKKLGFIREGYFKEDHFFNGKFLDTVLYSLLKS